MADNLISKKFVIAVLVACFVVMAVMVVMREGNAPGIYRSAVRPEQDMSFYYIQQRNSLSRTLNQQKQMFGQASCRMIKLREKSGEKVEENVSANGGWCQELSGSNSESHRFDEGFAKALSLFLKGKHVGSFGDGPGDYKKALESYKQVASYMAYDGAPFCEKTTDGRVKFLDLTGAQFGLPAYDWVVSVEVGEHIQQKFEDTYLDNLARHAKEGIILSWAIPGQGGLSHVNNQPLDHVIQQMNKRGFDIDKPAGGPMRKASEFYWLQANIHVYRRINPGSFRPDDV